MVADHWMCHIFPRLLILNWLNFWCHTNAAPTIALCVVHDSVQKLSWLPFYLNFLSHNRQVRRWDVTVNKFSCHCRFQRKTGCVRINLERRVKFVSCPHLVALLPGRDFFASGLVCSSDDALCLHHRHTALVQLRRPLHYIFLEVFISPLDR